MIKLWNLCKTASDFILIFIFSEVPQQSAITSDNVTLNIDGVLYLKVINPYNASYGVEDAEFAITQLAQTTMRSELGKMSLDRYFRRENAWMSA